MLTHDTLHYLQVSIVHEPSGFSVPPGVAKATNDFLVAFYVQIWELNDISEKSVADSKYELIFKVAASLWFIMMFKMLTFFGVHASV